jgi:glycerol-3-phosphate dehydrogenase
MTAMLARDYPFLGDDQALRLTRGYGTLAREILGDAKSRADLGEDFGHGLTGREVAYLIANEWARTAEDVLWRRTKLGLRFSPEEVAGLEAWVAANVPGPHPRSS